MAAMDSSSWFTFAILVIALIVAVVLLVYCIPSSSAASSEEEGYANPTPYTTHLSSSHEDDAHAGQNNNASMGASATGAMHSNVAQGGGVQAAEPLGDNEVPYPLQNGSDNASTPKDCFPKDTLTPAELLPADANSTWAQVVPAGQGSVGDGQLLTAGFHVGTNTVGQTLRNANMQLRSEPPNPQVKVSPWMQSTIEPDVNRKPLEIGGC